MTQHRDAPDLEQETSEQRWLYAKKDFRLVLERLRRLPAASRAKLQGSFAQKLLDETLAVDTPHGSLSFVLLGKTAAGRATSLLTKQPGTIEWIDTFRPNSVFWDVGANVGVYTLYAARRGDTKVVAFEPAAVNYFLLAANSEANSLDDRVDCLLLGVGGRSTIGRFDVSQFESAGSFKRHANDDPSRRARQAALVLSMDQLVEEFALPCPNYIKIDVPGMTEAVIDGGLRMLRRPDVRELHVELREQSKSGQRIVDVLKECGLVVTGRHSHGDSADVTFARQG